MQTYLSNIIPSLKKYSKKLDSLVLITDKYWIVIDELSDKKTSYYFRDNREVLINTNGTVKKGKWDYISSDSILIEVGDDIYNFRHGFLDDNIFVLRMDNTDQYMYLVSEKFINKTLNTIAAIDEFLKKEYLIASESLENPLIKTEGTLSDNFQNANNGETEFQKKAGNIAFIITLILLGILIFSVLATSS